MIDWRCTCCPAVAAAGRHVQSYNIESFECDKPSRACTAAGVLPGGAAGTVTAAPGPLPLGVAVRIWDGGEEILSTAVCGDRAAADDDRKHDKNNYMIIGNRGTIAALDDVAARNSGDYISSTIGVVNLNTILVPGSAPKRERENVYRDATLTIFSLPCRQMNRVRTSSDGGGWRAAVAA